MTRLIAILAVMAMPLAASAQTSFTAAIDGPQAVGCEPGGAGTGPSVGTGTGALTLDEGTGVLSFDISYSGLEGTESVAHVHGPALPGVPAGVVFPLPLGSPKLGSSPPLTVQQVADLQAGLYYVNIHSTLCGGGEIRGQVHPVVELSVSIDSVQAATVDDGGTGSGAGTVVLDLISDEIAFDISFSGISGTEVAAHFHGPAEVGVPAGVLYSLPIGSPKQDTVALTDLGDYTVAQQILDLLGGLWYVNIHTTPDFTGGEIRGQVNRIEGLTAPLDAAQAGNAGTAASGSGFGDFRFNPGTAELEYSISFGGLSSPELFAHLHGPAGPGVPAGVLYGLPNGSPKEGTIALVDLMAGAYPVAQQVADLRAGMWYVNIHYQDFTNGEIRGQVNLGLTLLASIDAEQAGGGDRDGDGNGTLVFDEIDNSLSYDIEFSGLTGTETAAHIHGPASPGLPAGVVYTILPAGSPKSGTITLQNPVDFKRDYPILEQIDELVGGLWYINIHSSLFPVGEIRGQILAAPEPSAGLLTAAAVLTLGALQRRRRKG